MKDNRRKMATAEDVMAYVADHVVRVVDRSAPDGTSYDMGDYDYECRAVNDGPEARPCAALDAAQQTRLEAMPRKRYPSAQESQAVLDCLRSGGRAKEHLRTARAVFRDIRERSSIHDNHFDGWPDSWTYSGANKRPRSGLSDAQILELADYYLSEPLQDSMFSEFILYGIDKPDLERRIAQARAKR